MLFREIVCIFECFDVLKAFKVNLFLVLKAGFPGYGYYPAPAGAATANGIAGGSAGSGSGNGTGSGTAGGNERTGSQPSPATYYEYTNGASPAATGGFHRGVEQHGAGGASGALPGTSPLLRDAYAAAGRSGESFNLSPFRLLAASRS